MADIRRCHTCAAMRIAASGSAVLCVFATTAGVRRCGCWAATRCRPPRRRRRAKRQPSKGEGRDASQAVQRAGGRFFALPVTSVIGAAVFVGDLARAQLALHRMPAWFVLGRFMRWARPAGNAAFTSRIQPAGRPRSPGRRIRTARSDAEMRTSLAIDCYAGLVRKLIHAGPPLRHTQPVEPRGDRAICCDEIVLDFRI